MARRRARSRHPGVSIKRRKLSSGRVVYRAFFNDPDTGRETAVTLDPKALSTKEAREAWAIDKSEAIAKRRMDIKRGAPLKTETDFDGAIADFLDSCRNRLRPNTVNSYRQSIEPFHVWARKAGVRFTEDLTPAKLVAYRHALVAEGRHDPVAGAKRGRRRPTGTKRSPVTTNTYLRSLGTFVNHLRSLGLTPHLHRDDIADALKPLKTPRERPKFLHPPALRTLLEAALRHDAAMFDLTREEHAGRRRKGTTPRHPPIAPYTAFLLLTGCRKGEALALRWAHVNLDAVDHTGTAIGEIYVPAANAKTGHARSIGLDVSPGLRGLLAMKHRGADRRAPCVFGGAGPYTSEVVDAARTRLVSQYAAPPFTWKMLRSTCATYLTNSTGIWGSATVFLSAKQLGHSVAVAERHYLGVLRGIPRDARSLEAAMEIEPVLARVIASIEPAAGALRLVQ